MQIRLRLPADLTALTGMGSSGRAAQRALSLALAADSTPVTPDAGAQPTTVYLTPELFDGLVAAGVPLSGMEAHAEAVIHGWALAVRKEQAEQRRAAQPDPAADLPTSSLREGQAQLLRSLIPPMEAGQVVFAEASTGIGKSRVLTLLAEYTRRQGRMATIAVPTVTLMAQMLAEFALLELPSPSVYLGRGQFVSPALLRCALADPVLGLSDADREALAQWDGTPIPGSPTARLAAQMPGLAWLRDDLLYLAPAFPADEVTLEEGEAHDSYDALREGWGERPVRLVTHAALAADMRLRELGRELLPALGDLLVDEAHLLEDAIGRAFSRSLSLHSMRLRLRRALAEDAGELRKKRIMACAERLLDAAEEAVRALAGAATPGQYLVHAGSNLSEQAAALRQALTRTCEAFAPDLARIVSAGGTLARSLADTAAAIEEVKAGRALTVVTLSRVRRYPGILTGRRGLGSVMAALWERTRAAVLMSATMFTDTAEHGISAGYFAGLLHVPRGRVHETPRVVAAWVYRTPTLYLPSSSLAPALIPPRTAADEDGAPDVREEEYHNTLADLIARLTTTAAGGTLVLCTSYHAITALAERLAGSLGARLMQQEPGQGLARGEHRFRAMGAQARPVWLATGGAWTGLDLRDPQVAACEDRLLTDVVIPRLPVQMPGTVHALLRSARTGLAAARIETALRLRQGTGRLMRAEGQPDRRLWLLDGRLWSPDKPNPYLCGPSLRSLDAYPNKRFVDRDSAISQARPALARNLRD